MLKRGKRRTNLKLVGSPLMLPNKAFLRHDHVYIGLGHLSSGKGLLRDILHLTELNKLSLLLDNVSLNEPETR